MKYHNNLMLSSNSPFQTSYKIPSPGDYASAPVNMRQRYNSTAVGKGVISPNKGSLSFMNDEQY